MRATGGVRPAGRAARMGLPQEFWPTETQPVVTDTVTVRWVADGSAAGWPCTFLHVTHVSWAAWSGGLHRAVGPPGSRANVSAQKASGKERPVQRLQFPCGEPGQVLPPETLLPFLAAVGRCCPWDTEQPGTLLSHCRCRWTGPRGAGGAHMASWLGARARRHGPLLALSRHPLGTCAPQPRPKLAVALLGVLPRPPSPPAQAPRCSSNLRSIAARMRPSWVPSWPWSSCCSRQGPRAPWTSSPWPCSSHRPVAS